MPLIYILGILEIFYLILLYDANHFHKIFFLLVYLTYFTSVIKKYFLRFLYRL